MKTLISLLFIIFSLVGIADASYLTYEKFSGVIPECGPGFDCGAVLNSTWSNIGPIPLSLLGLLFYITVFTIATLQVLEVEFSDVVTKLFKKNNAKQKPLWQSISTSELLLLLTSFGFVFSLYLLFIMGVVIQAWCQYCLVSAGTSMLLFVTSLVYFHTIEERSPFIPKLLLFKVIHFFYTTVFKKICFLLDAEKVHNTMVRFGSLLGNYRLSKWKTKLLFSFRNQYNIRVKDGIVFPNPVGLSAGFDYNGDLTQIAPSVGFGWHTIGTVTYDAYEGNQQPRLGRFVESQGLLVNKGFKSLGARAVIQKLQHANNGVFAIPTGISIGSTNRVFANTKEQILDILKTFFLFEHSQLKHAYYELNISCPNTVGGQPFTTPERLEGLLRAVELLEIQKPIYIKMPIDQSEAETLTLLKTIDPHPIAGVIFGNLTKDRNNPSMTAKDKEVWKTVVGNVSGKPTWHRSNALIALTKKHFKNRFTIIGTGGIFSGEDALEKIRLGADLLQLITGMIFEGPQTVGSINLTLAQNRNKK